MILSAMFRALESAIVRGGSRRQCISQVATTNPTVNMEEIVNLCKRKGFIFQSCDIYNSLSGFFDYGPLGVELKNNIKSLWWRDMVQRREDVVGIDCSIISPSSVWKSSGHLSSFSDPMVDCKVSRLRYRADQLYWGKLETVDNREVCFVTILEAAEMHDTALALALKQAKKLGIDGPFLPLVLKDLTEALPDELLKIPSPATGNPGDLTPPRDFNLMFQTNVGAVTDDSTTAYLRPETAQGIFANFANVQRTARMKVPFGIAQIGKSFRNEITPRNFIFRSREFEQMEIEYFIAPGEEVWKQHHAEWVNLYCNWLQTVGIPKDMLSLKVHEPGKLAHYALACTDINFNYPFGCSELMGVAARGDYDLRQHSAGSGKSLEYFDAKSNTKYLPHVIEPSIGIDRLILAILVSSYSVETLSETDKRIVLKLHPSIAPIKVVVLPLVSNNAGLLEKASGVFRKLNKVFCCEWDQSGAIGRRYRRADECGAVYCVTVDFDSLTDGMVTIRDRDTMEQIRVSIDSLEQTLRNKLEF